MPVRPRVDWGESAFLPLFLTQLLPSSHLESEVHTLRGKFEEWQGLLQSVNTASDTKFRVKHEELKRDLGKCEEMTRKVRMAVVNIERNRVKFPHIDDRELGQRKSAVDRLDAVSAP